MDRYYARRVAMSAATSIQVANGQKYNRDEPSWVADVRPSLALYLLLAVDDPEHAPQWLVGWMADTGLLVDADAWQPSRMVITRLLKMPKHKLVSTYRHGAVVYRMLAKRLVDVDPDDGRLAVKSPSALWERIDMMSRLYDEAVDRLYAMVDEWGDK